jgi:transcriptional regulator with XRE-family HTH domain
LLTLDYISLQFLFVKRQNQQKNNKIHFFVCKCLHALLFYTMYPRRLILKQREPEMKFYKNIFRQIRESRDVTQQEIADALGVTKQSVSNWENPNRPHQPSRKNIAKLAEFLDVAVVDLADVDPTADCIRRATPAFDLDAILNDPLSMDMLQTWSGMSRKERLQAALSINEIIERRPIAEKPVE